MTVDGETVFSKARERRFPANGELSSLVEPRLGPKLQWRSPG